MFEFIHAAIEFCKVLKEDPRIGLALAVLILAGAFVSILIGKSRTDEPISIRNIRK